MLGATTRSLQRACIETYGRSPITLRRFVLAQTARRRLALGESVASVSADLGFSSSGHLGRLLRRPPDRVWWAVLAGLLAAGKTRRQMVADLDDMGIKTPRGRSWSLAQLQAVLQRLRLV